MLFPLSALQTAIAAVGGPVILFYIVNWFLSKKKRINLQGKVVLITGANSGLGKACAYTFCKHGCNVILAGRNQDSLELVKTDLETLRIKNNNKASVVVMDLAQLDKIETKAQEALAIHGRIDIVINNAGISYRGCVADTEIDVHTKVMTVNYFGQIALTKAILPSMIEHGGGHIVAVSSVQGRIATPYRSAYTASKHALQAYFDCLRAEVARDNVSVCVVSPGYIQTNLSQNAVCADGANYGITDQTTATGLPAGCVAEVICAAVVRGQVEVTPAPLLPRLVIVLRSLWPNLYFWAMARRARKQRRQFVKQS